MFDRVIYQTPDGQSHDMYCMFLEFARENLRDAGEDFEPYDAKHIEWAIGSWESLDGCSEGYCTCGK